MSDIPDDIMQAAERAWLETHREGNISVDGLPIIARAILAERERCVQIADRYKPEPSCFYADGIEQSACLYGQGAAAGAIASAIRSPERAGE